MRIALLLTRRGFQLASLVGAALAFEGSALAYQPYLDELIAKGRDSGDCALCHMDPVAGGARNDYGKSLEARLEAKGVTSIDSAKFLEVLDDLKKENVDFDEDGATDWNELFVDNTDPGSIGERKVPSYGCGGDGKPGKRSEDASAMAAGFVLVAALRVGRRALGKRGNP